MSSNLVRQLRGDEGVEQYVYPDHLGYFTIGIGRLVDSRKPGCGLRDHEMDYLLNTDIADRVESLTRRLPWFVELDEARQGVLLNMAFQMGTDGLLKFVATLGHVESGDYEQAATQMLKSRWAQQTPARANRMAEQMRTGEWQFAEGT